MAAREGGGHPFNWFIIGFVVGVAATLAALLYLGVRRDAAPSDQVEARPTEAAPASAARAAIPALPAAPPAAAVKKPVAPVQPRPQTSQRELDEQMAEDAAAAGMTSRTRPGQTPPDQQ